MSGVRVPGAGSSIEPEASTTIRRSVRRSWMYQVASTWSTWCGLSTGIASAASGGSCCAPAGASLGLAARGLRSPAAVSAAAPAGWFSASSTSTSASAVAGSSAAFCVGNHVYRSETAKSLPASTAESRSRLGSSGTSAYSGTRPTSPAFVGSAALGPVTVRVTWYALESTSADASMSCLIQTVSAIAPAPTRPSPELPGSRTTILTPDLPSPSRLARPSQESPAERIFPAVRASVTM